MTLKPWTGLLLRGALAASLLGATAAAHAAAVTLTGWTFGAGQRVTTNAPYYDGRAGGFTGSLSGAGAAFDRASFQTYCVELTESFRFSATPMLGYEVVSGQSYFGGNTAERLGRLVSWVDADPTRVDNAGESAAMQLAIWNIVYDHDTSLSAGLFADSYAAPWRNGYASQLLVDSQALASSRFDVWVLRKAGSQDFLLTTLRVPEPGSLALAALALAAIGLPGVRRRRRRG